ncbi:transglycosylase SLT domain-containing protein [uncultured Succinivibrio sp.]|uniref:transglycosylase SLT domain-containing protein n=1 Tax=uncultured Succinivibrio sp. TaxID=540749 RepID=UPI0025E505C9|nr:transglycosylase SLT domain-containing protein [uncultured Succinivibrio sp.]
MKLSNIVKSLLLGTSFCFLAANFNCSYAAQTNSSKSAQTQKKVNKSNSSKKNNTAKNSKTSKATNTKKTSKSSRPNAQKKAPAKSNKNYFKEPIQRKEIRQTYVAPVVDLTAENPLLATTPKLINQRKYFQDAEAAAKKGDTAEALRIKKNHLEDYPLAIWIDYWNLTNNMDVSKYPKVVEFIRSDDHKELSQILKNKYIDFLARHGNYKQVSELIGKKKPFDDNMEMNSSQQTLQCRYYEARWHLGQADMSSQIFANKIYMQLKPYPSGCSGLIYVWGQNGNLNDTNRMDKFERLYIQRRYADSTRNLAAEFSDDSKFKNRINMAMALYDDPSRILNEEYEPGSDDIHRVAVLAFKRFANLKPEEANPHFEYFCKKFHITPTERLDIIQIISRGFLGRNSTLDEVNWVDKHLPAIEWTDEIKIMRMRKAIWFAQWNVVYDLYNHLNPNDKKEINWRYWKARAAYEIGEKDQSLILMKEVAKDRSFFGFLAAQELGQQPPFNHQRLSKSAKWPSTVAHNKAAIRFFEFRALDSANANIEWNEVAKHGSNDEALVMAEWALSTGNVNYAIMSVIAGKRWDALDYRFPKAFLNLYKKYSAVTNVPISFLYGISRQESMLNPNIKSPVGAVGLMQLMPETARVVSKKNNWDYNGPRDLVIPENNIRLGSAYLKDMLEKFDNNRILAAAAYNAGPNRIPRWKSADGKKRDTPMFIENIPFKETRLYVQNVLLYDVIYKKLLTGKTDLLLKENERKYKY